MLQEYHCLAKVPFLRNLVRNLHCLPLTDPLDLRQPLRFFLYDAECIGFKAPHDPCRKRCSHSLDRSGSKIAFDGKLIGRLLLFIMICLKLLSIRGMIYILTGNFYIFSFADCGKYANAGDLHLGIDQIQNRIPVICVAIYNMIHIACYYVQKFHPSRQTK